MHGMNKRQHLALPVQNTPRKTIWNELESGNGSWALELKTHLPSVMPQYQQMDGASHGHVFSVSLVFSRLSGSYTVLQMTRTKVSFKCGRKLHFIC